MNVQSKSWMPALAVIVGMTGVVLFVVLSTGYASFQDFGEWVYQGRVLSDLWVGRDAGVADFVPYPVPYAIHLVLLAGAIKVCGPVLGPVILLLLFVVFSVLCIRQFILANNLRPVASMIFLSSLIFGSGFWNGYLGAQLAVVFIILYLSLPERVTTRWYFFAVFGILMFATHAIGFAAWGLIALWKALEHSKVLQFLIGVFPSVSLTLWYALNSRQPGGRSDLYIDGIAQAIAYKGYAVAKLGSYQNLIMRGIGDFELSRPIFLLGVVTNLAFAVLIGAALLWSLLKLRILWKTFRGHYLVGGALIFLSVLLPNFFVGIVNPGERIMVPALVVMSIMWFSKTSGPRWLALGSSIIVISGFFMTLISLTIVPAKMDGRDQFSEVPRGNENRVSTFFGHRLDQYQLKQEESRDDAVDLPLDWSTSIIEKE